MHFPGMELDDCGGSWATTTGGPVGTNGGNSLLIQTQFQSVGSCTSRTRGAGAAISVVGTPGMPNDSVFLHATGTLGQVTIMRLVVGANSETLELTGADGLVTRSYDPTAMKWWRLSASGPNTLVGEYSSDATTWTILGVQSTGSEPATSITMAFGVSSASQGSASFDDYVQCQ